MIKKLNFYGAELRAGKTTIYRFDYLENLRTWLRSGDNRRAVKATDGEVRRALRITGKKRVFPVAID